MSYSDDLCMNMFTACQSTRINLCLDSTRTNTWIASGDCPPLKRPIDSGIAINTMEITIIPNPTSSRFECRFFAPTSGKVTIKVYNSQGKMEELLLAGELEKGSHALSFSPQIASGLYIIEVSGMDWSIHERFVFN